MRRRLSRLNRKYALGELTIVVVGVIIALAVDQWNTCRLDRIGEVSVDRLMSDLKADLVAVEFEPDALNKKVRYQVSRVSNTGPTIGSLR